MKATANDPEIKISGSDVYEWLPGGFFMLHKVDVYVGDERNETIEIIGFDKATNSYSMHYFDNKGNSGLMKATFDNGTWTFLGESLRFTGGFSVDGNILRGTWERLTDKGNRIQFMDIKLTKDKTK